MSELHRKLSIQVPDLPWKRVEINPDCPPGTAYLKDGELTAPTPRVAERAQAELRAWEKARQAKLSTIRKHLVQAEQDGN